MMITKILKIIRSSKLLSSILILLCVGTVFCAGYFISSAVSDKNNKHHESPTIAPSATPDLPLPSGGVSDVIRFVGISELKIKANETNVDTFIKNPESNTVRFCAKITMSDGRLLFSSGIIKPGETLERMDILFPLENGTYNAVLEITPIPDGNIEYNSFKTDFVIIAE